jgi:hypothetical protein
LPQRSRCLADTRVDDEVVLRNDRLVVRAALDAPKQPAKRAPWPSNQPMIIIADDATSCPVRRLDPARTGTHTSCGGGGPFQSLSTTERSIRPALRDCDWHVPIAWGVSGWREIRDDHAKGLGRTGLSECFRRGV